MIRINKQLTPGDIVRKNNGKKTYFVVETTTDGQWCRFDVRGNWVHNSSVTILKTAEQFFTEIANLPKKGTSTTVAENVDTITDAGVVNSN